MNDVEIKQRDGKLTISIDVENIKTTFCQTVEVNTARLNIRSRSSCSSSIIGYLERRDRVDITDVFCGTKGFVWGKLADEEGWICLNYCTTVIKIMC